ncbi:type IV secretion system protein [Caballeronia sordidicola]|uniref:TrbL/VirB6 plasmid conjugal transfer protein n=1 Tax=Caballeronia sordidicola TaxID=196367 RepID=A0A226WNY0_CABSO|nr:type IV secretion system protein [Caballeronia sordidicola]OXC72477.1 hypothetical protein BSU04_41865 [Caballeronia sordidicola]
MVRSFRTLRLAIVCVGIFLGASYGLQTANAQLVTAADAPAATGAAAATTPAVPAGTPGEFGKGSNDAVGQIASLLNSLIPNAVTLSQKVMPEANKFAWGLGVITIVLAGVRFAGTHHPVSAWIAVFEEITILGIFVALYLGYTTAAPGFWNWFVALGSAINNGASSDVASQMATLAGTIVDALRQNFTVYGALTNLPSFIADAAVLLLAFVVMAIASVFFAYYTAIGQIQSAIGIVLGPIALALGFSSYTRNYFQKWLDWMVSAGMYVVVVQILMGLVGTSITSALKTATTVGGHTTMNAAYVFDLAVFVLLLSLEIPKLAGIFGGGASASGTSGVKTLSKAATGFL